MDPPGVLFAEFTDEEDSDGEGDTESELARRRTAEAGSRADGSGMVLPRFADLMRSMRDVDSLPSFALPPAPSEPAVVGRAVPRPATAAPSSSTASQPAPSVSSAAPATVPRRRRVCRECATEVFVHGLKDWWAREMRTTLGMERLPVWVVGRKMCDDGEDCNEQGNYGASCVFGLTSVVLTSRVLGGSDHSKTCK
jgi:hypothetical protein